MRGRNVGHALLCLVLAVSVSGCGKRGGKTASVPEATPGGPVIAGSQPGGTADAESMPGGTQPDGNEAERSSRTRIVFPPDPGGQNTEDSPLFRTEPFALEMALPEGWTARRPARGAAPSTEMELVSGGKVVGKADFGLVDAAGPLDAETDYVSIYADLMLGSMDNWNNDYRVVAKTEAGSTAVCREMVKDTGPEWQGRMADAPMRMKPAILSYDGQRGVYIAVSFEPGALTGEEWLSAALSVRVGPA